MQTWQDTGPAHAEGAEGDIRQADAATGDMTGTQMATYMIQRAQVRALLAISWRLDILIDDLRVAAGDARAR
jgi:hypothetical protein